jgi:hypothetical protein
VRASGALAGSGRRSYLAAAALLAVTACRVAPAVPTPAGAFTPLSVAAFESVAERTVPRRRELVTFHWRFDAGEGPVKGRGAARVAPPDSLRLDFGVPVLGRATLVLAGDSAWSQPPGMVEHALPQRALVWALFGVVRLGEDVDAIERGTTSDGRALLRLSGADGMVTTLVLRNGALLGAFAARGGRTVGSLTLFRGTDGEVERAQTVDLEHGARFEVTVDRREASEAFPSAIWRHP